MMLLPFLSVSLNLVIYFEKRLLFILFDVFQLDQIHNPGERKDKFPKPNFNFNIFRPYYT